MMNAGKYKTAICRNYAAGIQCRFGAGCHYAHGQHELRTYDRTQAAPGAAGAPPPVTGPPPPGPGSLISAIEFVQDEWSLFLATLLEPSATHLHARLCDPLCDPWPGEEQTSMEVANELLGNLLGPGGTRIREIRMHSGARVFVEAKHVNPVRGHTSAKCAASGHTSNGR